MLHFGILSVRSKMASKIIVHISEVDIQREGGMARVEYHWKEAFEKRGINFIHIGPYEVGKTKHKALFSYQAYRYYRKLHLKPIAFIIHEPYALFFLSSKIPVFIESHGSERRAWELIKKEEKISISLKTRILFPIWRLMQCDIGLKKAFRLLLVNSDDKQYVIKKYNRQNDEILIFKNGFNAILDSTLPKEFTILFNGSWIERKGISTLIDAARLLYEQKLEINYLIIGSGCNKDKVLSDWPIELHERVDVIPRFDFKEEQSLLDKASVVVLPSNFEGQPLSLLQAMAAGKCCITTNCCGQKDFILDRETGFLFEPKIPENLQNSLYSLIKI